MISKNVIEYRKKFNQSFEEAQKLLNDMKEVIHIYGYLTIADFHELVGCTSSVFSDTYYGWTDISKSSIEKTPFGYFIDMPSPKCLNDKKLLFNSVYGAKPRWNIVIPQVLHDVTSIDHNIIPSMMSEEVFPHNSAVNHPNHYQSETGLEVIDVIDAFTDGLDGVEAFDTGNIIKYICRWKKKNGIEDLEKAKWYLENLIKKVKEKENEDAK